MNRLTIVNIVLLFNVCALVAQDIQLNSFTHSVEGTKIKAKPGRHVCTTEKTISRPIPVIQTYRKPVYTPKPRECPNISTCPQFDVSYTLANRTIYQLQKSSTFEMNCCPGWTKKQKREKGCMQPICKNGCGDFGVCVKPETCECAPGYSGPMCDTDVDECRTNSHGCQHQCKNTAGSYMCACQEGFNLAADGRTCSFCFTCQKEYTELLDAISSLKVSRQVTKHVTVDNSAEFSDLNTTIQELRQEVMQVKDENTKMKVHIQTLENQYDEAVYEIENLQNLTRTTTPPPTTSTTSTTSTTTTTVPTTTTTTTPTTTTTTPTTTTTTTTTTQPTTTTTRTTTPDVTEAQTTPGLQFDIFDIITSLSNQIGLMEEKLELCQCTYQGASRRGYG